MIINEYGVYVMEKRDEWRRKIAPERGFLPLHQMAQEYRDATIKLVKEEQGITAVFSDPPEGIRAPTKEEWREYNRAGDIWIAEEVLRDWGWTLFVSFCKSTGIEDLITKHYPCEGPDGQCEMTCLRFNDCSFR